MFPQCVTTEKCFIMRNHQTRWAEDLPTLSISFCLSPHYPGIWNLFNAHLLNETLGLCLHWTQSGSRRGSRYTEPQCRKKIKKTSKNPFQSLSLKSNSFNMLTNEQSRTVYLGLQCKHFSNSWYHLTHCVLAYSWRTVRYKNFTSVLDFSVYPEALTI